MVQYRYIRRHDKDGNVLQTGGITVVYRVDEDKVVYQFSVCSNKDQFSKKIGKEVSRIRLAENPLEVPGEVVIDYFTNMSLETLKGLNLKAATKVIDNLSLEDINPDFLVELGIYLFLED